MNLPIDTLSILIAVVLARLNPGWVNSLAVLVTIRSSTL